MRDDERRKERREYYADVCYDVWRRGGNPDFVNYDRVQDAYYDLKLAEDAATQEMTHQRPEPEPEPEQEYPVCECAIGLYGPQTCPVHAPEWDEKDE